MDRDNNIIVAIYGGLDIGHGACEAEARGFVRGMITAIEGAEEADETLRHTMFAPASPEVAAMIREGRDPGPLEIVDGVARGEVAQ